MSNGIQLISGRYLAAPPVLADGQIAPLLFDSVGRVLVGGTVTAEPPSVPNASLFANLGASNDAAVKITPGRVFSALIINGAGTRFFQLHNIIGAIPAAAIPFFTVFLPANTTVIVGSDFFGQPIPGPSNTLLGGTFMSVGIRWGFSTSQNTFVAAGAGTQTTFITFI